MAENNLSIGNKITLEINSNSTTEDFSAVVKKLKKQLVALKLVDEDIKPSIISAGVSAQIKCLDTSPPQLSSGKVVETKSFPLIIVKLEKTEHVEKSTDKVSSDEDDESHVSSRDSARITDTFLIEYYYIDKVKADEKKDDYMLRPTRYRRQQAKEDAQGGRDSSDMIEKIAHIDPALLDVIRDIYFKISRLSEQEGDEKGSGSSSDDNMGECIDISGSGIKMLCSQKFKIGDILKMMVAPPNANPPFSISFLAIVQNVNSEKSGKYETGIQYYAMHDEDMEEIVRYTFLLQREQLSLRKKMQRSE